MEVVRERIGDNQVAMPKRRTQPKQNGKRYSDTEKMVARHIVSAAGGVVTEDLLKQVQVALNIKTLAWDTLARWVKEPVETTPTPTNTTESRDQQEKTVEVPQLDYQKAATREIVEATFRRYAARANNHTAVETTEAKDAAKVMADMLKLMQLLDGMPTEIVGMIPDLVEFSKLAQRKGYSIQDVIRANSQTLSELPDIEMITAGSGVN